MQQFDRLNSDQEQLREIVANACGLVDPYGHPARSRMVADGWKLTQIRGNGGQGRLIG
jgi:hypothetical protein